jgi:hypothetical protein
LNLETKQNLLPVGQIADDAPKGQRQLLDQRWSRQNFLVFGPLRVLENVDYLELVLARQLILA